MDQVHILLDPVHRGGPRTRGPSVILLPLHPVFSDTQKSPRTQNNSRHESCRTQRVIIRSIDLYGFKPEVNPTSSQTKRVISSAYKIGQEVLSERIRRGISTQISFISKLPLLIYLMEWLLIMFTLYGKHVAEPRSPTMDILRVGLAKKDKKMSPKKNF